MSYPKKDPTQKHELPTAPLPLKNAERNLAGETSQHEEELLDTALESTFPASDPVAETEAMTASDQDVLEADILEHEEFLLDEALTMTFPASDPIAIPDTETVSRTVHQHH